MVPQVADASMRQQHQQGHGGCDDGRRQLLEERGGPPGAVQQYLLARQQPGVLCPTVEKTRNASRGAGGNFAAMNVEEALADIWALGEAEPALDGGVSLPLPLPLPPPLCRRADEALLEIRRDQPHLQQCRSSQNAHGQPAVGAMSHESGTKAGIGREGVLGPCSFATQHLNQHPLHQQQLQNQYGNGMPTDAMANEQQRYGRIIGISDHNTRSGGPAMESLDNGAKAASKYCGGGIGFGGGDWGGGITGSQMGAASPKSSISSDGSGGDTVGNSPAAVWEVGMRRGASKGGGGGGGGGGAGSGGGGRKSPLDAADEHAVGLWQSQMSRSSDSSARLRDREQSMDALKQLFLCANMELETALGSDKEDMLLQLLRITSFERDEAKDQLQRLLTKIAQASPVEQSPTHFHPDPLLIGRTRCNFDSSYQAPSYHPYVSSPVGSLFDPTPPPVLPHKIVADSSNTATTQQQAPLPESMPPESADFDPASAIIDRLVMKRPLPEKGKLLQAVMEAGPLLQTLLVAGSLPRWRNPPPLQPFQIPPVSVIGPEPGILHQNYLVQSSPKAFQHQNSLVASQIYAAPFLGSSGLSAFCQRAPTPSTCASSYQGRVGKRQKF